MATYKRYTQGGTLEVVRGYTERRHSMRLSVYRYILLLGYALRANPTYAQNHCVMTNYYRSGGYGLRPNRPYGLRELF